MPVSDLNLVINLHEFNSLLITYTQKKNNNHIPQKIILIVKTNSHCHA